MKETSTGQCLCKAKPCNCVHANVVNPIAISLSNFPFSSNPEVLNQFALQAALLAGRYGGSDIYPGLLWNPSPPLLDAAQVVSSSDQVVRQRNPSSRTRRKDNESTSPVSPVLLSPPVSTSSPVEKDSSQDNQSRTNGRLPVRGRKYVCSECQRSFDYKHVLQNHERTHTGEKPFECSTCQKKFTRDHHLKTHMRLHTGEKPYKCTHCDKDFVQVANLRRHIKVHELPKSPKEVKQEVKLPIQPLKQHLCQRFSPLEDICTVSSNVIIGPPQDKPEDLSIKKKKSMSSSHQFKIWSPSIIK